MEDSVRITYFDTRTLLIITANNLVFPQYDQHPGPSHGYDSHPWSAQGYAPQPASSFGYDLQQGSTQWHGLQPRSFGYGAQQDSAQGNDTQPGPSSGYNTQPAVLFGCDLQPSPSLGYDPQPGVAHEFNSQPGSSLSSSVLQGCAQGYDLGQGGVPGHSAQLDQQPAPCHRRDGPSGSPQHLGASPSPSSASRASSTRRGYRHRHTRQFLQDAEQRVKRTRVLNNEASILYRANVRARYDQVQQELDDHERRKQQLSQRFRQLQWLRDEYKRILEAMDVPAPLS